MIEELMDLGLLIKIKIKIKNNKMKINLEKLHAFEKKNLESPISLNMIDNMIDNMINIIVSGQSGLIAKNTLLSLGILEKEKQPDQQLNS